MEQTAPGTPPPAPPTPAASPSADPTVADLIRQEATRAGVPPELALAVGEQESGFNPTLVNPQAVNGEHATGTFQLLPSTAKRLGVDPAHPVENIRGGVQYLRELLDANQGDLTKVLSTYGGVKSNTTYVPSVLARMARFGSLKPGQPPPGPQPVHTAPPASPEQFTRPKTTLETIAPTVLGMAESFDPRSPEGRRNLGGAVGAAAGTMLASPSALVSGPAGPATGGVMGAMAGGALVGGGEALIRHVTGAPELGGDVGTPPPTLSEAARQGLAAGTEQGVYEMGGRAMVWPVQIVGRQLIGSRVGRYAAQKISTSKAATLGSLQAALDASQDLFRRTRAGARTASAQAETTGRQLVSQAAGGVRQTIGRATETGTAQKATAEGLAQAGTREATEAAAQGEAAARAPYEALVGTPPPSAAAAGKATTETIQQGGPARARDVAGQAVEAAAKAGPAVDIAPLKAEAKRILEREIKPPAAAFPRTSPSTITPEEISAASGMSPESIIEMGQKAQAGDARAAANLADLQAAVESAGGEHAKEVLKHPALQVLNRILNAEDSVAFADAHAFKRELDEAVGSAWDRSVKTRVTNITKTLRGQLRGALAGFEPYNQATAAYQQIAPLFTQGVAPKLRRLATEEPEAIVRLLNPAQPTKAAMLVELLTTQAAAGGGEAEGRAALEAVQSAWVRQKLINGGIENLGARVDKLPPEFVHAFLSDPKAKGVLDNLKLISTAYHVAVQEGERGIAAAKTAGTEGVGAVSDLAKQRTGAVREAGYQTMDQARQRSAGIRAQTAAQGQQATEAARAQVPQAQTALRTGKSAFRTQEDELAASSLGGVASKGSIERRGADVLRAMMLGPRSTWGGISILRLLHGPTAQDLIHFSAASPAGTRAFVKAITSPVPGLAIGDLLRSSGILAETTELAGGRSQKAPSGPPPAPSPIGTPPPAIGSIARQ